jgi:FlaA1/EpsC-like NDP-sugar epimerase
MVVRVFMLFDMLILAFSFALAAIPVSQLTAKVSFVSFLSMRVKVQNIVILLVLFLMWHFIFSIFGLYESKRLSDRWGEVRDVLKSTLFGTLVVLLMAWTFRIRMVTPIFILAFWAISTFITVSSRLLLRSFLKRVRKHGRNLRQMLIVGTNQRAVQFARSIEGMPDMGYRLVGFADEQWLGTNEMQGTRSPCQVSSRHI